MRPEMACPVCTAARWRPVIRRAAVPRFQNRLHPTRESARAGAVVPVDVVICVGCGYMTNRAATAAGHEFDASYDSDQTASPRFSAYVDEVARRIVTALPAGGRLLEIGCGQGYFLARVEAIAGTRLAAAWGFDAVWRGGSSLARSTVFPMPFSAATAARLPVTVDVAVTRHAIDYMADPVAVLRAARSALRGNSGRLFVETGNARTSFAAGAVEAISGEVRSWFCEGSLRRALDRAGFAVESVTETFAGQYLLAEARPGRRRTAPADPDDMLAVAERFAGAAESLTDTLGRRIRAAGARGGVAIWGSGTRGASLAALIDPEATLLRGLIDVSLERQGRFLSATGHAILSPADAARTGVRRVFVANDAYRDEIGRMIADAALPFTLEPR